MKRKILRNIDTLMEDRILPHTMRLGDAEKGRRDKAILEVLQTIPEDVYKKLIDCIDNFRWFIPHEYTYGVVCPFPTTTPGQILKEGQTNHSALNVLYLSPVLEKDEIEWTVVVAVVAHELAHIALDHELFIPNTKEEAIAEGEVYKMLCEWGFKEEAMKHP